MRVLVTGGAGYIGSHTVLKLVGDGHEVCVYDNFSRATRESLDRVELAVARSIPCIVGELSDGERLSATLREFGADAVVHCAGLKSVEESVERPDLYELNNVAGTERLAEAMVRAGTRRVVFSSTATVYSPAAPPPVPEGATIGPTNAYGLSKWRAEAVLQRPEIEAVHLRYFNAVGADPGGRLGEAGAGSRNLLPILLSRLAAGRTDVDVFGLDWPTPDGSCVRDYVHVDDIARANVLALQMPLARGRALAANIGTGRGYSVIEVVRAVERATGRALEVRERPRRPGDIATSIADVRLAADRLGFVARYDLDAMVSDAVRWELSLR